MQNEHYFIGICRHNFLELFGETSKLIRSTPPVKAERSGRRTSTAHSVVSKDDKRRFKFDDIDTIPYWCEDILRIFPTVSQDQVLEIAERWILDKWGADPEANWWNKEPRKARYDERRSNYGRTDTVPSNGRALWHTS